MRIGRRLEAGCRSQSYMYIGIIQDEKKFNNFFYGNEGGSETIFFASDCTSHEVEAQKRVKILNELPLNCNFILH